MKTVRIYCLITAALLWTYFSMCAQAIPLPLDSSEATTEAASPTPQEPSTWPKAGGDPIETLLARSRRAVAKNDGVFVSRSVNGAAPGAYPGWRTDPSSWNPTHFEIEGFAQWRNLSSSANISTANQGNISLASDLGIGNLTAGPLFRFIWTPERKIKGATSKIWVEYGQINRSNTRTVTESFTFEGKTYDINSTLKGELRTRQFELGYAPRWGNAKFRIGPSFTYERLTATFTLTDLTPGAEPPITQEVDVPNNIVLLGADFDYMPVKQFDIYGKFGAIPCCGGGWHGSELEFGAKYYFTRSFSLLGGVRYSYLKRDFDVPATVVNGETVGPFSGSLKFPGVGPFVGASFRF